MLSLILIFGTLNAQATAGSESQTEPDVAVSSGQVSDYADDPDVFDNLGVGNATTSNGQMSECPDLSDELTDTDVTISNGCSG